jgi:hypothetical protein
MSGPHQAEFLDRSLGALYALRTFRVYVCRSLLFATAWALAIVPSVAHAGAFVSPEGTSVDSQLVRAFIRYDGSNETFIEEEEVISTARAFAWFRTVPGKNAVAKKADPAILPALADLTYVRPPHNDSIRSKLFGPSVVTLLTRKLSPPQQPIRDPLDIDTTDRVLEIGETVELREPIPTSTITHRPIIPDSVLALLGRVEAQMEPSLEHLVSAALNRGDLVLVSIVRDSRPSAITRAKLGPFQYDFIAPRPTHPMQLTRSVQATPLRVYTLASGPLAPGAYESVWIEEPWYPIEQETRAYYVSYNTPVREDSAAHFELREKLGFQMPATPHLMRANATLNAGDRSELIFLPPHEPVELPGDSARGSARDLFICVLLSVTPLLYTPESWFFLWLGARAKARARREGRAFGIRLWALYAVAVGAFWFFALENNARIACLVPLLIGAAQLALPYLERDPLPVRSQFKKKKK